MKRLNFVLCCGLAMMIGMPMVRAQVFKPIDFNKRASDIENKTVHFGDVNLGTLSPGTHGTADLPLSGKKANLKDVNLSEVDLKMLNNFSELRMKTLPQQNFTAKRAALPNNVPPQAPLSLSHSRAPINRREIRAFTPAGEQELRKQLQGLPPPYGGNTVQSLPPPSDK